MRLLTQNHITYGLLMLGITTLCLLFMELTGNNDSFAQDSPYTLIYTFIAPFFVWFLGLKAYKKAHKGKMHFKEGVFESFKIALVYAVTSPILFLLYYTLINPDILNYVRSVYGLSNASDQVVIAADMLVQFVAAIIGGTVYGAILSYFLKSK